MKKKILFDQELRREILEGVRKLSKAVSSTLGPKGRNVIIRHKEKLPFMTKDGVTVAQSFVISDNVVQNAAAQIVKEVSLNTNKEVGDGTTTATILTHSILENSDKYLTSGISPIELQRGIEKISSFILDEIHSEKQFVKTEEDVKNIATISANGDEEIAEIVATAVTSVGLDGAVTVENGFGKTSLDMKEGFLYPSGFLTPHFITNLDLRNTTTLNPFIFITDYDISAVEHFMPVIEVAAAVNRDVLLIAPSINKTALKALISNELSEKTVNRVIPIEAAFFGNRQSDVLFDLATKVGATVISIKNNLVFGQAAIKHLGTAEKVEINNYQTLFLAVGNQEEIDYRLKDIEHQMKQPNTPPEDEQFMHERILRLRSAVAIIQAGGNSKLEMIEKKHRIQDSIEAVKAAITFGYLPGGGSFLLKVADKFESDGFSLGEKGGVEIIKKACTEPVRQLAKNSGLVPDVVVNTVLKSEKNCGVNMSNGLECNLIDSGIIDPAQVIEVSFKNAVSVAGTLLMAGVGIIEEE